MADISEANISAADLESVFDEIRPSYGYWRTTPREEDGGWLELIGPDDSGYAEAQRRDSLYWSAQCNAWIKEN